MKKLLVIFAAVLFVIMNYLPASASSRDLAEKQKKVHSQYTVQEMDKLEIDNIYGRVHINTWDKNEVTIDIKVTAKARTEDQAQEILDRITFITSSNDDGSHRIYCKTVLESSTHNTQSSEMTIDYTINAPKKIALDITNKYGDVYLGDCSGKVRMNVSYGALDMQTISGSDKRIKVAFGSAMINSIESGILDISYSNLTIDNATDIDVTNKFGNTNITTVQNLKIDQKYGNIELGEVNMVAGNIDYSNIEVDNLRKSAELILKYSGKADFKSIGAGADLVNIDAYYSNMFCRIAEGADLSIDIATSYSAVKKGIFSKSIELTNLDPNSSKSEHYRGKAGKGTGSMTINAHYSNINFK